MAAPEIALLRAFPPLRGRLPRFPVLDAPTPVAPLALDGLPPDRLWVKRDDLSCPLYGGNKPRKLELVLGGALAAGARRLVTTGGLGTHHGLATTVLGRAAGLRTTLVLVAQPLTEAVRDTLLLQAAYGARLRYGGGVAGAAAQVLRSLAGSALRGERPWWVATGGSSPRGNAGFVSAALELAEQVRAGLLPEPAQIWVAVGTGGTLAGLAGGLALAGLRSRLMGVLVTDILPPSPRRLAAAARRTLAWLRRLHPELPRPEIASGDFELLRDQLGAGYGAATPAAREAVAAAAAAGLDLETTYTGKCLAALRERARRGALGSGPLLFWNTYNSAALWPAAPSPPDPASLPRRFQRLLAEAPR